MQISPFESGKLKPGCIIPAVLFPDRNRYREKTAYLLISEHGRFFTIPNNFPIFHQDDPGNLRDNIMKVMCYQYNAGPGLCYFPEVLRKV